MKMNRIFLKTLRFILNFGFYAAILITTTYYVYMTPPELFGLKNAIAPINGIAILTIFIALILSTTNEIINIFIIRISRR